jgi:hypothetical protein
MMTMPVLTNPTHRPGQGKVGKKDGEQPKQTTRPSTQHGNKNKHAKHKYKSLENIRIIHRYLETYISRGDEMSCPRAMFKPPNTPIVPSNKHVLNIRLFANLPIHTLENPRSSQMKWLPRTVPSPVAPQVVHPGGPCGLGAARREVCVLDTRTLHRSSDTHTFADSKYGRNAVLRRWELARASATPRGTVLQSFAVKDTTQKRYAAVLAQFKAWLGSELPTATWESLVTDMRMLEICLLAYFDHLCLRMSRREPRPWQLLVTTTRAYTSSGDGT